VTVTICLSRELKDGAEFLVVMVIMTHPDKYKIIIIICILIFSRLDLHNYFHNYLSLFIFVSAGIYNVLH